MAQKNEDADRRLIKRIQREVSRGINSDEGDTTDVRQVMFERYYGEEFGNERPGFSTFVSREVFEAIEWCLPSLIRVLLGGARAVKFSASSGDDEAQAEHETDVVNYWFHNGTQEDSGFMTLYSWLKDVLMYPNGYVKVSVREVTEEETTRFKAVSEIDFRALQAKDDIDVVVDKTYDSPNVPGAKVYDISVTQDVFQRGVEVIPVPPDEVIIQHGHTKLNLDEAGFVAHRCRKTRSQLIEMGYDAKDLEDVGPDDSGAWNDEKITMLFYGEESPDAPEDEDDDADELIWYFECNLRFDYDGDGVAELRRVTMAGTKILENEPTDYVGIVAASAIHVTHKHIGMSLAETVADLQELMSTLTRQLLDNIYKQNVSRKYVAEGALLSDNSTMDALLDARSEVIVTRGSPAEAVMPEPVTSIVAEMGQVITAMRELPQLRTGVAPTLTLDPSVLEKSTMGAFLGALEQASQRLELLVRLFAETGFKRVFQKIHYLLRNHFDEPQQVKINGKWVTAEPSTWKRRSNMSVGVGLGFNNKQVMIGLLTQLLSIQKEAMAAGLADPGRVYNTLKELIEQANLGHAETFFIDPKTPEYKSPQPQPDAAMILAQAQAASLKRDSDRKDKELNAKLAHEKEKFEHEKAVQLEQDEFKSNEQTHKIDELDLKKEELRYKKRLIDAQVQELNARAFKEGIAPEDPTIRDEAARVDADEEGGEDVEATPDTGLSDLAKAVTSHSDVLREHIMRTPNGVPPGALNGEPPNVPPIG